MTESTGGKFLYETVTARVASQAADYAALSGRSKDLIGLATITSTVMGVLANERLVNLTKMRRVPASYSIVAVASLILVLGPGLFVLWPRKWHLSPSPEDALATVNAHPTWPTDSYYATLATGFVNRGVVDAKLNALEVNDRNIARIRWAVLAQIGGLSALAVSGLALTLHASHP